MVSYEKLRIDELPAATQRPFYPYVNVCSVFPGALVDYGSATVKGGVPESPKARRSSAGGIVC